MIEKDFRALLPVWLSAVAAVALSHAAGRNWEWLGVSAYFLGAPAIGSYVFGHEFTHRTTGMLLTLPVPRGRIWLSKMLLAVALVTPLTGIAMYVGPLRGGADARAVEIALFTLTTLGGICLASWLTMLARNPLAGTVFTCGLAGVLMLVGAWIGVNLYGYTSEVDNFQVWFMWGTIVPLCAVGVVLGWRTFVELEVRDAEDASIHLNLPRGARTARATLSRRHPLLLLAVKELRLQQLAWALALILVLLYTGLVLWRRGAADADTLAQALTMFFSGAIAIVLGSVMTAEERQLGTLDMQLLQPVAGWEQWFVKAGVALVSATILTILLPVALASILPPEGGGRFFLQNRVPPQFVASITVIVASSAYISSLSLTTMRAVTGSIAAVIGLAVAFQRVFMVVTEQAWRGTHTVTGRFVHGPSLRGGAGDFFWWMFVAGVVLLTLWFAGANHRQANRSPARVGAQVAAVALMAVAGFALAGALGVR